jgi:hypothetical protein
MSPVLFLPVAAAGERHVFRHECRGRARSRHVVPLHRDVVDRVDYVCGVQFIDGRLFDSYDTFERNRLAGAAVLRPAPLGAAERNRAHNAARTAGLA